MISKSSEIFHPLSLEQFDAEHRGKAALHLEGPDDKWTELMSWPILGRLLEMTTIWSAASLLMVLDKETVAPTAYAEQAPGRDGGHVLRPVASKVKALLKQGATLVLNDIDQLTPELAAFSRLLEEHLGGKVQANLYMSSQKKQGFKAHFDTHDVFAVHVMGEKVWHVFEGIAEDPIAHVAFKNLPQEHHEKAKGKLWREVRLTPGDLLYLPRGQYHYAIADEGATAHVAFGVTYPIGIDVMTFLFERMVAEPLCRRNLPADPGDLRAHLAQLGARLHEVLAEPETLSRMQGFQQNYHYPRETFELPGMLDQSRIVWRVKASGVRLVEQGGRYGLVQEVSRKAVAIPSETQPLVAWVLARKTFTFQDIERAFSTKSKHSLEEFLKGMANMALIAVE